MKTDIKKINKAATVISVLAFIAAFAASLALFWKYVIDASLNQTMQGVALDVSGVYIAASFIFFALLFAISIVGFLLKNKYMLLLSAAYQVLLIIGILLLTFMVGGQIGNEALYEVLMWVLMVLVAPVYGAVWILGSWFIALFAALFIATVVFIVFTFRKKK